MGKPSKRRRIDRSSGDRPSPSPLETFKRRAIRRPDDSVPETSNRWGILRSSGNRPLPPPPSHRDRIKFVLDGIVDSVMNQYTSTSAEFHVNGFCYDKADSPKLEEWLRSTEQRHVEDLRLELDISLQAMYILPQFLFFLSSLVRLQVSRCYFSLGATSINWPGLKFLSMSNVNLSDDILASILRGSPVLESLELGRCLGLNNVVIDSTTSVKHLFLSITNMFDLRGTSAPHLLKLSVVGTCSCSEGAEHMSLEDIWSLLEAELDFEILTGGPANIKMSCDLLKELLEKLCRVPTITIGDWCLQILSLMEMKGVLPPSLTCQNLILHGSVSQWDLPGIAYNLRSSQCLKKLVIHLTGSPMLKFQVDEESKEGFNFDEEDFLCSRKGNFG